MKHPVILASASPQRKTLLEGIGLRFQVVPSRVAESSCGETDPRRRALTLASLKARDVAVTHPGAFVIGCDTLVVTDDGTLLEKPDDERAARRMLDLQSGHVSVVYSGLALITPDGREFTDCSINFVHFRELSPEDKDWWIRTGQWKDRSGGFQIDGQGQLMIGKIEGDFTSVVGLPVYLLGELFRRAGTPLDRLLL